MALLVQVVAGVSADATVCRSRRAEDELVVDSILFLGVYNYTP